MFNRLKKVAAPITLLLILTLILIGVPVFSAEQEESNEQVFYYLHDHLGGIDTVLDEDGNVVERRDYLPFGKTRAEVIAETEHPELYEDYGYTGKEKDSETGLHYYGARYYDSEIGRFTQIDPLVLDEAGKSLASVLTNPQELNSYSYVTNNPLRFVDENGIWGSDVHLDLTMFLAESAGFSSLDALGIGLANNFTDTDPNTEPGLNIPNYLTGVTEEYHFQTLSNALTKVNSAIQNQDLKAFGTSLHTFQDTYSHTMSPPGHVFRNIMEYLGMKGADPDKTHYHPRAAKFMAYNSFTLMRDYLRKNITDKDELVKFNKDTQTLWQDVQNTVYQFIESNDENKINLLKIEKKDKIENEE